MEILHRRHFQVATYDLGPSGETRPSAFMGFMEETAGTHTTEWGLSVPQLLPRGLTWVLSRYHLRLLRAAHYGDALEVATWPSARSTIFATREFEVTGDDGAPIAAATTSWVLLDLATRRPRPLRDAVPEGFILDRRALLDDFSESLPALPEGADGGVALPVMLRDLDMNLHVNHRVYVQWALEAVPLELLRAGLPTDIEISYQAEARRGDRILSRTAEGPSGDGARVLLHAITHAETGRELARLRTTWKA